tara:strand:- start:263 stop:544 length:282 start_codon:yes stop_codon:yes gene_type:complete
MKQLFKRLSHSYRHHDYHKWIGPEDGRHPDGTRKGVVHFIYTDPWFNAIIDWVMWDILKMDYTYHYIGQLGWSKVYDLDKIMNDPDDGSWVGR